MIWDCLIILWGFALWMTLTVLLRSDPIRLSLRQLLALCVVISVVLVAGYIPLHQLLRDSLVRVNIYGTIMWASVSIIAFWLYPGQNGFKTLYFLFLVGTIIPVCLGPGNLAESTLVTALPPRLLNLLVNTIVAIPVISGILAVQKRFSDIYESDDSGTWLYLFVLAGVFFVMQLSAGSILTIKNTRPEIFLLARLTTVFAMFAILYIAGLARKLAHEIAVLSARAAAIEKMISEKDKKYADIVTRAEEARRLRHDLRQMYAAILGMNDPAQTRELKAYCRELLIQLAAEKQEDDKFEYL